MSIGIHNGCIGQHSAIHSHCQKAFFQDIIMLKTSLPRLFCLCSAFCLMAILTACGGNVDGATSAAAPVLAANAVNMPSADCEPQACQGLRIIDSNTETFRADGARRDALAASVARLDDAGIPAQ